MCERDTADAGFKVARATADHGLFVPAHFSRTGLRVIEPSTTLRDIRIGTILMVENVPEPRN
jgi:hypothetical protein